MFCMWQMGALGNQTNISVTLILALLLQIYFLIFKIEKSLKYILTSNSPVL